MTIGGGEFGLLGVSCRWLGGGWQWCAPGYLGSIDGFLTGAGRMSHMRHFCMVVGFWTIARGVG